ncbi:CYTH domain-containing protein [Shewanella sp. 3B26]|uniref:CYTH domain-containing protein n=1 Tax=Shewanella zhuhaiensis TaxID=2919576 RepID=A0AAJ1BHM2_9GAMM|nr:CYTH domain-containing protein [Shewanella zhuhaiensis]MCH4294931.1 CYTH domain-containing protein [Shewanella zhuhaiensis]
MDAEIELKLFFLPEFKDTLITEINHLFVETFQTDVMLSNGYFDTDALQLRSWDMGLRVRGRNGKREQTIKTAGKVVGGIHSRPEYNVDIDTDTPDLTLFPARIWPEDADLADTQAKLNCVFHTDFRRLTWLVSEGASQVEIALDEGTVRSGNREEPLCELEFELMSGQAADLLTLAEKLMARVPMRLGKASKAQRGYRLAGLGAKPMLAQLDTVPLPPQCSAAEAFAATLETALERWQLLEDAIAQSAADPQSAAPLWARLRTCIGLLEAGCRQFGALSDNLQSGFGQVRRALAFVDDAVALSAIAENRDSLFGRRPDAQRWQTEAQNWMAQESVQARLESLWRLPAYGKVQLELVTLLFGNPVESDLAVKQVANQLQQASWEGIQQLMPAKASTTDFLALGAALDDALLVGLAYGELYSADARRQYRAPWQDLRRGIDALRAYVLLGDMAGPDAEMQDWLEDKALSLMHALEQSHKSALAQPPYWR